jgi:hypothetical protein
MTQLLQQAIEQVQKLTSDEQDAIATMILDEIVDERRWDEAFARSQDQLSKLAEKVRADISTGKTRDLGIDEL